MKKLLPLLAVLVGLGSSCALAQESKSPMRTWTSSVGTKVEAELLSLTGDQVSLKTKEGKILRLHLHKLSKADQKLLSEMDLRDARAPTLDGVTPPLSDAGSDNSKSDGLNLEKIEVREGMHYLNGSDTPYTGKVFALAANGTKVREANIKDGKFDGLAVEWHENGQKKSETTLKDGKPDGLWAEWRENGQKASERTYKDGKKDGLMTAWYENGQKSYEATYKDGELISGSNTFWKRNGEEMFKE